MEEAERRHRSRCIAVDKAGRRHSAKLPPDAVIKDPTVMLDNAIEEDTVEDDAIATGEAVVERPAPNYVGFENRKYAYR